MSEPSPARLLEVIEKDIVPLTRDGVRAGNKIFGAAILRKSDASLVVAGTNAETENPLWHGEVSAIRAFFELPHAERPAAAECWFVATHEPCSLCLSAITWAGFDNFYYFFGYAATRDAFEIPHDLKILEEVFGCRDGGYRHMNAYWRGYSIRTLIDGDEQLRVRADQLQTLYEEMSSDYQASKSATDIPLA